jgi:ATP-dependent helicase/nuclease subunit A
MSAPSQIPAAVLQNQIAASDPATSAWVSANAGSGKTFVLVQRVIRLLLDGVDPGKILCLTFTKAAAANMANRVFETLGSWTALSDTELGDKIDAIEGRRPNEKRRLRARRLFAEALETPGGLKVQTIHAFCTALLHQFPFEADVAAGFGVLEDHSEQELIDRLRLEVLLEGAASPDSPLGRALQAAIVAAADTTFADVVREVIAERAGLEGWIAHAGGLDAALAKLSRELGVGPDESADDIRAAFLDGLILPKSDWQAVVAALAQGLQTDRDHVDRFARAMCGAEQEHIDAYLQVFCTGKLEPRKNIVTKGIKSKYPDLADRLLREQARVCALLDRQRAVATRDRTAALLRIAHEVLRRYRTEKERRGLLDYDDLIEKTLKLFGNTAAAWVLYKLDLGIDHVLIDEAQDTSPQQWEVIRQLTAEFTAGHGARDVRRSIFAVGDEKQSIYSFQGAAPHRFDEMRRHFRRQHEASEMKFELVKFEYSFRSAPDVLGAVDEVFGRRQAFEGLTADPVATVHRAVRATAPGLVEIWPLEEPAQKEPIEAWDAPFDIASEQSPRVRLARRIAASVRTWIERGDPVDDKGRTRAVRPGDILVLVRQRGGLFEAIIRALKDADVEVAGADRLVLTEHIAIMDLMSLADALLLPEDDLALAEALKSPLFGFDDDLLFQLAHDRAGTLRAALRQKEGARILFGQAAAALDALAVAAREQTPFAFYAELLGAGQGRRKMLARLGTEAADALDEFLALALDYESRHTPSLQGFLAWLRTARSEVKRDMDIARDEVRVMTVHGAKGLEAPIVILADTATRPTGPRDPRLLHLAADGAASDAHAPLVWAGPKAADVPAVANAREAARLAADQEHRRLLYVAMTRAADRLVVAGAVGANGLPQGCWYRLVSDALAPTAVKVPADDGPGEVWRWQKSAPVAGPHSVETVRVPQAAGPELPAWLTREAPRETAPPASLAPSRIHKGGGPGKPSNGEEARAARQRGTLVHRLMQSLPDIVPEKRLETARRFLARAHPPLPEAAVESVLRQVLGILDHPDFAALFAPGTRAEVPVVARFRGSDGQWQPVARQIDRLAVTADSVLIADFKTDKAPPVRPEDVPPGYVEQLAVYRLALARLYPGQKVRAALVFTENALLIELPGSALDAALSRPGGIAP